MLHIKHLSRSVALRWPMNINSCHLLNGIVWWPLSDSKVWVLRSNLHEAPLLSPFSKIQVHILFWRSQTVDWLVSVFVSKDTSSAVLLSVVQGLLSVSWARVAVQGLGWWLRRSAFSLMIHKEKINSGLRVTLAWPELITVLRWAFGSFIEISPALHVLCSLSGHPSHWPMYTSNRRYEMVETVSLCVFTQIEGDAR